MIPILGAVLGVGLLLVASPWLWPRRVGGARAVSSGGRVADRLARAGFSGIAPGAFLAVSVLLGVVAAALAQALLALPVVAVIALIGGVITPWSVAGWRARTRIRAHRGLWPEVVDHLVASVRAGRPLPDAIAALADEGPEPLRGGFALFARRWYETGTMGTALDAVKDHFADSTADRLFEIVRMARQVGGTELPGVLRDLSSALRQDLALRAEVEARQSWVTNAAKLGVAAPWIVLVLLATRPEAAHAYNTPGGLVLIVCALVVSVVAYRLMIAIGRLPDEQRWFR